MSLTNIINIERKAFSGNKVLLKGKSYCYNSTFKAIFLAKRIIFAEQNEKWDILKILFLLLKNASFVRAVFLSKQDKLSLIYEIFRKACGENSAVQSTYCKRKTISVLQNITQIRTAVLKAFGVDIFHRNYSWDMFYCMLEQVVMQGGLSAFEYGIPLENGAEQLLQMACEKMNGGD